MSLHSLYMYPLKLNLIILLFNHNPLHSYVEYIFLNAVLCIFIDINNVVLLINKCWGLQDKDMEFYGRIVVQLLKYSN